MASETRPGVIVTQALSETTAVTASPTLVPLVMAPCFQIIKANKDDGSIDSTAKHSANYTQSSLTITQAQFPDPRDNIDEVEIYEDTIEVHLAESTGLSKLQRGSDGSKGSSFLARIEDIYRPAVVFAGFDSSGSINNVFTDGNTLVFAIDVANATNDKKDTTIVFAASDNTAAKVVEAINEGYGAVVSFVTSAGTVALFSPTYGPAGSVTIREGGSALSSLTDGAPFQDNQGNGVTGDVRVEGSGLFAQDDEDPDETSPFIAYQQGIAKFSATSYSNSFTELSAWPSWAGFNDGSLSSPSLKSTQASLVTFGGSSPTIPLKAATTTTPGDVLFADSKNPQNSEVILVEESRFKLGKINSKSSTRSATTGELVTRIYDTIEFNILTTGAPFSPTNAYFKAQNLVYGEIENQTSAKLTGTADNVIAWQSAIIGGTLHADLQSGQSIAAGGLTIKIQETIDGVQKETVTVTAIGTSSASDIADRITNNTDLDCTASIVGENIVITSSKKGAQQSLSIKSDGTLNSKLGFDTSSATSASGRDFEIAAQAEFITEEFDPTAAAVQTANVHITFADASNDEYTVNGTLSAAAPFATMADVATAISVLFDGQSGDGTIRVKGKPVATVEAVGETLKFSTVEGGANAGILVVTAEPDLGIFSASYKFSNIAFGDIGDLTAFTLADVDGTLNAFTGLSSTTTQAIAATLNSTGAFNSHYFAYAPDSATVKVLHTNTAKTGNLIISNVTGGSATVVAANAAAMSDVDEAGSDKLKGSTLTFKLDDNPTEHALTSGFDYNSVAEFVDDVNEKVGGDYDIASFNSSTGVISLESSATGIASKVEIVTASSTAHGATIIDFSVTEITGTGRPNPDFYIDPITKAAVIGPNILRNISTGIPFKISDTNASLYIDYKGLRIDVTASASDPGLLTFGSIDEISASIGPINTDNPLGLAAYLCFLNSSTSSISCLGIDETTSAAPTGTVNAYLRALELAESKEVYSLAPMTDDHYIQQLISTHVQTLSQPSERGERIALLWKATPERENDTLIEGGSGSGTLTGSDNEMTAASNLASAIISEGISDLTAIDFDDNLYVEVTCVSGSVTAVKNYSISSVSGFTFSFRTSFTGTENIDGFFSTDTFSGTASYSSLKYVLKVRGDKLLITGTQLPDVTKITQTAAAQASAFSHRRVFLLFGDSVDVSIDGQSTNIPGYYITAGLAGMIASQLPQQPFTNFSMVGYSKVYGTDDTYSENQLDVIADGGRYVLKNLAGGIAARHQRSTSNTTIEARELSITKAIDYLAKGLREVNRVFIGRFVITPGFLDQLTMANEGFLRNATNQGVVRSSSLQSLLQSETAPDTVLIEVEVQPAYPCNKIRITIVS